MQNDKDLPEVESGSQKKKKKKIYIYSEFYSQITKPQTEFTQNYYLLPSLKLSGEYKNRAATEKTLEVVCF